MTKKSDMASRYAAAHARRDQRRGVAAPTRQYLPLADEPTPAELAAAGARSSLVLGRGNSATLVSRLPAIDYSYLRGDLIRIAILAVILFVAMIVLSFFL